MAKGIADGKPPKSLSLKIIDGANKQQHVLETHEREMNMNYPYNGLLQKLPKWPFSEKPNKEVAKLFKDFCRYAMRMGILQDADVVPLAMIALETALVERLMAQADAEISASIKAAQEGDLSKVKFQKSGTLATIEGMMNKLAVQWAYFGFTPGARTRIHVDMRTGKGLANLAMRSGAGDKKEKADEDSGSGESFLNW